MDQHRLAIKYLVEKEMSCGNRKRKREITFKFKYR